METFKDVCSNRVSVDLNYKVPENALAWSIDDFEFVQKLSVRADAIFLLAKDNQSKHYVVIKVYTDYEGAETECAAYQSLASDRPNILAMYGYFYSKASKFGPIRLDRFNQNDMLPFGILEYCWKGSLEEWLKESSVGQAKKVLQHVVDGLEFVHSRGCTHSNIIPSHLMIGNDGITMKLSDFTLSIHNNDGPAKYVGGADLNMAPELILPALVRHDEGFTNFN